MIKVGQKMEYQEGERRDAEREGGGDMSCNCGELKKNSALKV
jgi:hypothetical protein